MGQGQQVDRNLSNYICATFIQYDIRSLNGKASVVAQCSMSDNSISLRGDDYFYITLPASSYPKQPATSNQQRMLTSSSSLSISKPENIPLHDTRRVGFVLVPPLMPNQ